MWRSGTIPVLLALLLLPACSDSGTAPPGDGDGDDGGEPAVASVTVEPSEVTLQVGQTTALEATVTDQGGSTLSVSVTWASSDSDVARVNDQGVVTGVAAGEATVTAEADGVTGSADVTVEEPTTGTTQTIRRAEDVIEEVLPDPNVPLEERDARAELVEVAERVAEVEGVLAVVSSPASLTAQIVLRDGLNVLFIHNRFEADAGGSGAVARGVGRIEEGYASSVPGSPRAVVANFDGGAGLAGDVESMLEEAGYEIARDLGGGPSERSSLEDMRAYGRMSALYLDTHGAAYQPIEVVRNDEGDVTGLEGEGLRYAYQTSTTVSGPEAIATLEPELERGDLIASIATNQLGEVQASIAITDKFIARHWSFDGGVAVINACSSGSGRTEIEIDCGGEVECSLLAEEVVLDPSVMRTAIMNAGVDALVTMDGSTNARYSGPSIRFLFDRLLGADTFRPREPPTRPFPGDAVLEAMADEGLDHFQFPETITLDVFGNTIYAGTGRVDLTFDGDLSQLQLAPTIRKADVLEGPEAGGELTLSGRFGEDAGAVTMGDAPVDVLAWGSREITARVPYEGAGSSGPLRVEGAGGQESNEVPMTEWTGQIEVSYEPGPGDLLATATVDVVARADVHPFRDDLLDEPDRAPARAYFTPASAGRVVGEGSSETREFSGETDLTVLSERVLLQGASGEDGIFGGYLEVDPDEGTADLCLLVTGSVTVRQGGTEFQQAVIITPPGLESRNALGCAEVTLNDDLSVSSGSFSETGLYTLEWSALEPTSVPDEDTAG